MQAISSLVLALCVINLALAERSPVFLWGTNSVAIPSLQTVQTDDFKGLVTPLLTEKSLVVFLADHLSNKDFLCTNDVNGKSCFARLQGVKDKTFYAAVQNPVEALREIIGGEIEYNTVDASGKFSKPLKTTAGEINFVKLVGDFQSHDSVMAAITSQYDNNVFYIYTSAPSTSLLNRQRRQSGDAPEAKVFREGGKLLLYFTSLSISTEKSVNYLDVDSMTVNSLNDTSMSVVLKPKSGPSLSFYVTLAGGYFFMTNVMYTHESKEFNFLSSEVFAPTDFSYFCGNLTLNNIPSEEVPRYTLKWNYLQFQAPFAKTQNETFVFGDAWHCVGFFTGGILSGLLIVALLLTITFIGVCWMMDINTMDRFDDPKGKTITINASE